MQNLRQSGQQTARMSVWTRWSLLATTLILVSPRSSAHLNILASPPSLWEVSKLSGFGSRHRGSIHKHSGKSSSLSQMFCCSINTFGMSSSESNLNRYSNNYGCQMRSNVLLTSSDNELLLTFCNTFIKSLVTLLSHS